METGSVDAGALASAAPGPALGDAPIDRRTPVPGSWITSLLSRMALILVLLVLVGVFSALRPDTFPTIGNLRTITSTQSVLIVVSLGLLFPLAVGEFDLSFGAILGLSSSTLAYLTVNEHWSFPAALGVVLAAAVVIGLINSFLIVMLGVNSFIVTLGVASVLTGLTLRITNSAVIAGGPHSLATLSTGRLFGLQYPVYFGAALALLVWYVLQHTPFGRYVYFIGEARDVARLAGVRVDAIRTIAFLVVAVVSALAGCLNLGTLGSADPNIGATFLLPAFAAVFLGATTIVPGRFNGIGTLVAVYLLVVGVTGIQLLGGAGYWQQIFNGGALIAAVSLAHLARRRAIESQ